ncbi:alkaline phosphatase [Calothrix sp. NIES-4071]|nr:alkaline phosphatase [Calothrix sp. NIES-4071]BAZ62410.1 alkaline phosphatase [Calothrix sp. NIES-4105]
MIAIRRKYQKWLALMASAILLTFVAFGCNQVLQSTRGNGINVILMIGDGMGWQMARAGAVGLGAPMYTSGKGQGLNFQKLSGYTLATNYSTIIQGKDGSFSPNNSALDETNFETGKSAVTSGFVFKPAFNNTDSKNPTSSNGGNLVGYDPVRGGQNPWTLGSDKEYIKLNYPDSAGTATTLYTGNKTYNNAMGVDIYERRQTTILEQAALKGKSTGLVTSVPISHATPGAAASFVNRRSKYDAPNADLDNILQQTLKIFKPTVLLGGGHPLDLDNKTARGGFNNYVYMMESTYKEFKEKPKDNSYGYTFVERGPNAAQTLLETAKSLDPNKREKLLGLYGARGQSGNLPFSTANGDYSSTGFDSASVYSTASKNQQIPKPDTVRPLLPGETDADFIKREINENPTLSDLTQAALTVLGKDPDGFWLMVEGGDIDWACHDDNMDNLIGTVKDFDKAVGTVVSWINLNGGWKKNLLIVTADHDHYLTLNPNFEELLTTVGAEDLTYNKHKPTEAAHFWGSDSSIKYGWGNHSNHLVPVYYQGGPVSFDKYVGQNVTFIDHPPGGAAKTYSIPGVKGAVDQSHIYKVMLEAITAPVAKS